MARFPTRPLHARPINLSGQESLYQCQAGKAGSVSFTLWVGTGDFVTPQSDDIAGGSYHLDSAKIWGRRSSDRVLTETPVGPGHVAGLDLENCTI